MSKLGHIVIIEDDKDDQEILQQIFEELKSPMKYDVLTMGKQLSTIWQMPM